MPKYTSPLSFHALNYNERRLGKRESCNIHTYTHTHIHTHTHRHNIHTYIHNIHTYIHTYTHTYIHTYIHTHTYIHVYILFHLHTYTYMVITKVYSTNIVTDNLYIQCIHTKLPMHYQKIKEKKITKGPLKCNNLTIVQFN